MVFGLVSSVEGTIWTAALAGIEAKEGVGAGLTRSDSVVSVKSKAGGIVADRAGLNHKLLYI